MEEIKQWQELIGSFLGASIAVFFSAIGFFIARYVKQVDARKEALRRIEISNTYSLQSSFEMESRLRFLAERVRELVSDIQAVQNPREFVFSTINFPALGQIFVDTQNHHAGLKSYYLHNKLLIAHGGITSVNLVITQFKEDFAYLVRLNEKLVELMGKNPNPPSQRDAYANNLEGYANEVERFANLLSENMKVLVQIRIYNQKLRGFWFEGLFSRWHFEGLPWSQKDLDMIDRIDAQINDEVMHNSAIAKKRAEKIEAERKNS